MRVLVDQDYVNRLPDEAKAWLADFNNGFYSHDFRNKHGSEIEWTPELRKEAYRIDNHSRSDVLNRDDVVWLDGMKPELRAYYIAKIERRRFDEAFSNNPEEWPGGTRAVINPVKEPDENAKNATPRPSKRRRTRKKRAR